MDTFLHVLTWLLSAAGGAGFTYFATNWAKISPVIPITEGRKTQVRAFAGVMAALAVVVLSFVNTDIKPEDLQSAVVTILTFAISWFGAHKIDQAVK